MNSFFKSKSSLIFILIIILFVILNLTGFTKEIKNFFYLISSPIEKVFWRTGDWTSDFFGGILEMKILRKEVEALYQKNQELLSQIVILKELKKENESLRTALKVGLEKDFQLKLSRIVSKDISKDSILINKGEKDGISKGFPVMTNQKILLGKIGEVYENFSEVILITNEKSSFDAKVSEKEIYGIVKGKGNLELYLDFIPKDKEIFQGELIVTTVLGGIFPANLLVGEIKMVEKSDVKPFQTAEIKPGFEIGELDNLFIIIDF